MTVKDIILDYLETNGYDGLCKEEDCGCSVKDFMPCCGEYIDDCEPAYSLEVPKGIESDGDYELYTTKEALEEKKKYYQELLKEMEKP